MVLTNIEKLIKKYEDAKTSIQEEQQLRDYFSQESVAPHLEVYKPLFMYFSVTQHEQFTKDVPLKSKKKINIYQWISVAAVFAIMFGIYSQFVGFGNTSQPTDEQLMAYNQVVNALAMFNKGVQHADALELMSASINKGSENIAYLSEFSDTTNKIFKN